MASKQHSGTQQNKTHYSVSLQNKGTGQYCHGRPAPKATGGLQSSQMTYKYGCRLAVPESEIPFLL